MPTRAARPDAKRCTTAWPQRARSSRAATATLTMLALVALVALGGCATSPPPAGPIGPTRMAYSEGELIIQMSAQGQCDMQLQGRINAEFEKAFLLAHQQMQSYGCASRRLVLNSGGGLVAAALKAGDIIRRSGYTTEVASSAKARCASSCGFLFIAGVERIARGGADSLQGSPVRELGLHQPSRRSADGQRSCQTDENIRPAFQARVKSYIEKMLPAEGADIYFRLMMETDCKRMRYLTTEEILRYGIATRG